MEVIIATEAFRDELRAFSGLVDRSNTLAEMSNLLIETKEDKIFISGTDGDVSLRTELTPEFFESVAPGAVCIRADKLTDVLGTLDHNVKSVRLKEEANGWANLLFARSHFRISGIKADLYPAISVARKEETEAVKFPAGLLLQFLSSTNQAISNQDTQYVMTGANLIVGEKAHMVSTDGFRVASIESPLAGSFNGIFPKKAISIISKMLADVSPEVMVELSGETNHIFLAIGNKRLSFRRLNGDFPNVAGILAVDNDHKVLFNLYDLRASIRRADIFADKNNQSGVTLTIRPGEVEIHARSFEEGSGNELIDAQYDGPEIKIKIKSSFLVDFFNSVNSEGPGVVLSLEFSDDDKRATIWTVHRDKDVELGYDYKCLITKLR